MQLAPIGPVAGSAPDRCMGRINGMSHHEERAENVEKLWLLSKDIKFGMLTTAEADGTLRSRPMATQQSPFDGDRWFFTYGRAPKVQEIEEDHHVNISYADPDDNRYVSVSGTARLVRDRAKMEELWNPIYKAWFPDGLDTPDIALLQVTVTQAEYWDATNNKLVQLAGFVKALATGQRAEGGENEKLDLERGA
jgi:general stress protein 26